MTRRPPGVLQMRAWAAQKVQGTPCSVGCGVLLQLELKSVGLQRCAGLLDAASWARVGWTDLAVQQQPAKWR